MLKKFAFISATALLSLLVVGVGGEVLVRLLSPQLTFAKIQETPWVFRSSELLPFELAPGSHVRHQSAEYDVVYRIGPAGLRGTTTYGPEPAEGVYRVLALGDSFTFGNGVLVEESWPAALEQSLNRDQPPLRFEVINAAYACGFSPDAYELFLRERIQLYNPDGIVVALFVWNDIDDIRNNEWIDVNEAGLPGSIRSNVNYIDSQGRRVRSEHYPLKYRVPLLRNSQLFVLLADRVAPSAEHTSPTYTKLVFQRELAPELTEAYGRFERSLRSIRDQASAAGVDLLVMLIPAVVQLQPEDPELRAFYSSTPPESFDPEEPNRRIRDTLDDLAIVFVDVLPSFRSRAAEPDTESAPLYFPVDGHWTAAGHSLAAQLLVEPTRRWAGDPG